MSTRPASASEAATVLSEKHSTSNLKLKAHKHEHEIPSEKSTGSVTAMKSQAEAVELKPVPFTSLFRLVHGSLLLYLDTD